MKAEIAVMTAENIDRKAIARGGEILKNGGLVAFPTGKISRRASDRRRHLPGECGRISGGWRQPRDRNLLCV